VSGFSAPTISHSFENADATPASGAIQFTLTGRMQNGTKSIVPASITATLSGSGGLSQAVTSNLDPGTVPAAPMNTQWRVDLRILGSSVETYYVTVPPIQTETNGSTASGSAVVTLSSLTADDFMVGQSITGTGIPTSTTILSVNTTANTVTMSANATATGTALSLVLGATIDLGQLLPSTQQI
jgi:hypothetical protein